MNNVIQELKDFIIQNIEKHRETLEPSMPRDLIDSFLLRMDKARAQLSWGGCTDEAGHTSDTDLNFYVQLY